MKMGRRLRCSSVTYRFRYAPSSRLAERPILIPTIYLLFRGQDTNIQTLLKPTVCLLLMRRCTSRTARGASGVSSTRNVAIFRKPARNGGDRSAESRFQRLQLSKGAADARCSESPNS